MRSRNGSSPARPERRRAAHARSLFLLLWVSGPPTLARASTAAFSVARPAGAGRTDAGAWVGLQEWVQEAGAAVRYGISSEDEIAGRLSVAGESVPTVPGPLTGVGLGGEAYTRIVRSDAAQPFDMGLDASFDLGLWNGLDLLHLDLPWMAGVTFEPVTLYAGAGLFATYAVGPFSRGDLGPLVLSGFALDLGGVSVGVDFRLRVNDSFWPVEQGILSVSAAL